MKKSLLLAVVLVMSVCSWAQDWADLGGLVVSPAPTGSEWADGTAFYTITNKNNGSISTSSLNNNTYVALDGNSSDENAQWAIIADGENGYKFVNRATNKYIKSEKAAEDNRSSNKNASTFVDNASEATTFDIAKAIMNGEAVQHLVVKIHGDGNHYWNKQDSKLAIWNSAEGYTGWNNSGKGDDGSKFKFELVESIGLTTTTITWNIVDGETVKATYVAQNCVEGGEYTASFNLPYVTLNGQLTVTAGKENQTINLTYTENLPFTVSTSSNKVYGKLHANSNENYFAYLDENGVAKFTASSASSEGDQYLWYITGNSFDGIQLWNKSSEKALSAATDPASVNSEEKNVWQLRAGKTGSKFTEGIFALTADGTNYLNCQSNSLKFWTDPDNGSTFMWELVESEGPTDEPTLSFNDNKDKTFTITPSSATDKWYAAIVPASTFDEVAEEEMAETASGALSFFTTDNLSSLEDAYAGAQTITAAELYAKQNEEAELEAGEYFVVAGYVQGVALGESTMVLPKTVQWFAYTVAGEEGPTDEPTLSFTDNEDNTFTVTPSSATDKWYAAIVPASTFDEVAEEEMAETASGALSFFTTDNLSSLEDAYTGAQTITAAELYAKQNEEAELEAGEYFVVAGYVQGVALGESTMVLPKTVQWFAYTQHEEEGEGEEKKPNTTTKFFTGAELRAEVAAVGIAKVGLVNVTSTSNKYVNGKAYNGTPASANNTLAGVRVPLADEILEVVAVEGGYTLRQADAAEGEGYLKCAAGGNFTTSTAAEANVWKIASEGEDGFDVKGTITNYDDLYTDIDKSINPNMVRFVSEGQYLNGQSRDSQSGLRGGTGAWSFVYVYNANYIEATTGVGTVLAPVATESIFNLQGQRIVKLQKGINIVGGKKVIK